MTKLNGVPRGEAARGGYGDERPARGVSPAGSSGGVLQLDSRLNDLTTLRTCLSSTKHGNENRNSVGGQHLVALARLGGGWRRVRTKGADVRRGMDSSRYEPVPARANSRLSETGWSSVGSCDQARGNGMEIGPRPEGWRTERMAKKVSRSAVP